MMIVLFLNAATCGLFLGYLIDVTNTQSILVDPLATLYAIILLVILSIAGLALISIIISD